MIKTPLRVVIGYDHREPEAFVVARHSLLRHASIPLMVTRLDIHALQASGIYTREYSKIDGQMIDKSDGRPFSTEFAFSRFFVPALCLYDGWALFCDCDFLFTQDVAKLLPLLDDKYAVMVAKKDHKTTETVKMDNQQQAQYPRKNWSSFVFFNNEHPKNRLLNTLTVNAHPGRWLHGFNWLEDADIGELPQKWNWLAGVDAVTEEFPAAVHYTLGIPTMPGHENTPHADLWREELERALAPRSSVIDLSRMKRNTE